MLVITLSPSGRCRVFKDVRNLSIERGGAETNLFCQLYFVPKSYKMIQIFCIFTGKGVIMDSRFYKYLVLLLPILTGFISACGAIASQATPTATRTPPPTNTPTLTPTPTKTPIPTKTPDLAATQQYEEFTGLVQNFYDTGKIASTDGTYKRLGDFSQQIAMSYGYEWLKTGENIKEFIIRANFEWEVANQKNNSGCGFVFRQISDDHYYMVVLDAVNGVLLFSTKLGLNEFGRQATFHDLVRAIQKASLPDMGNNPYQAEVTIIVAGSELLMFVNGDFYSEHRLQNDKLNESGELSFLVLTGSATDFGTRCKITDTELWIISP